MDFNQNEEKILNYWREHSIIEKIREKNKAGKPYYFLDGPPYVSGELHPGQIWVKARKDAFLRYKRMKGFNVHDRAGYDVHGLPIERKIELSMKISSKKEIAERIGVEAFIKACREYTDSLMPKMSRDYERFGVSLDFKNPYIPYKDSYIEEAWRILKVANEKKLLYKDKKPMAYCPQCETVLAQGTIEVSYSDEEDPSLLVKFRINTALSKPRIDADDNTYLVIWTTTPWTLPANVVAAVNPKEMYVRARIGDEHFIMAKSRLDAVVGGANENATVEAEFYGSELEGIYYINPLEDLVPEQKKFRKHHKVVMSERLVSVNEGSGIIHVAPGHGYEDYLVGREMKLPVVSPLDMHAKYTAEAGAYEGLSVPDAANERVIADLAARKALIETGRIRHSYPHCWRCGTKLLYLATDQWFLNIQRIKRKLISENSKVRWNPTEAKLWQEEIFRNSPDWCISRQRYWGIPLPIWECGNCGEATVIGSREELKKLAIEGASVDSLPTLHRPYVDAVRIKCPKCGGEAAKIPDVFDVWFDSGIAFKASLDDKEFGLLFPAEMITEGHDQLRGWFSTLMKSSVIMYGKSPYKNVIVSGFMLAEDGREMHKSLGNYVSVEDFLKFASADPFRLWSLGHTQWLDLPFNRAEISEAQRAVLTLYNLSNLMDEYADAIGYRPKLSKPKNVGKLDYEEAWILSRLESAKAAVTEGFENYNVDVSVNRLGSFLVNDLSRFYIKLAKKKILYRSKSISKKVLDTLNYLFFNLLLMYAPLAPFASEDIYLARYAYKESIFLEDWPKQAKRLANNDLEKMFGIATDSITALLNSREKAGIRLRWPAKSARLEIAHDDAYEAVERLSEVIKEYVNVKELELAKSSGTEEEVRPNFSKIGPEFKEAASAIAEALKGANVGELSSAVAGQGYYNLHTSLGMFAVKAEHFTIVKKVEAGDAVAFKYGRASINAEVTEELMEEALVREFERRVQLIRKEMKLRKADKILLGYTAVGKIKSAIEKNIKEIKSDLNVNKLLQSAEGELVKNFEIEGEEVKVGISKSA